VEDIMANKDEKTLGTAIDEIITALEGLEPNARATAVTAACAHLGIPTGTGPPSESAQSNVLESQPKVSDIKTLKQEKGPRSTSEMACLVAYYLQELAQPKERKDTLTTKDIEKYFKQANFKLPKVVPQVLPNAKASGYFDSAGSGSYKLNAVGYNLAVHTLPRKKSES
jgi:hypothetical protein